MTAKIVEISKLSRYRNDHIYKNWRICTSTKIAQVEHTKTRQANFSINKKKSAKVKSCRKWTCATKAEAISIILIVVTIYRAHCKLSLPHKFITLCVSLCSHCDNMYQVRVNHGTPTAFSSLVMTSLLMISWKCDFLRSMVHLLPRNVYYHK